MNIEMMTRQPQWSDWSTGEGTTVERQSSLITNEENNATSMNTLIDVNEDDSRRYHKTK
jgi:hypothetical protein